jgi:hypothetical protein
MASNISKSITSFLLVTFILWYLLRRTTLGQAYAEDMLAIPVGAGEGLNSIFQTVRW